MLLLGKKSLLTRSCLFEDPDRDADSENRRSVVWWVSAIVRSTVADAMLPVIVGACEVRR